MRIFLIVLLVLAVLTGLLCVSAATAEISFRNESFGWCVRYCGIKILPRPEKAGGKAKQKKKKPQKEPAQEVKHLLMDKLVLKLQDIAGKADMAGSALYALPKPLQRFLRGIQWYAIETDFVIGGEDAAECANLYGRVHSLLHPLLGCTGSVLKVKRKRISVVCDFTADTCKWDFACKFKIRIGTVLLFGIGLVWNYFMDSRKAGKQLSGAKI